MNKQNLKEKIQNTKLFSNNEKIRLLVKFDDLSKKELKNLNEVIDDFDASHTSLCKKFKVNMKEELEKIQKQNNLEEVKDAISKINNGLDIIIPNGD
ncbi:hypothetical protein GF362_04920 [Candidatus Dojkabacteria bacterium]|nr:hypothetical protein [Candidatus Dojkabacteria bacterium]